MKIRFIIAIVAILCSVNLVSAQSGKMTEQEAWKWYNQYEWLCGVNYIPANAINYTAMWDKTSFSPKVMDKELALMSSLGMNCVRVVMQHAVYADNPRHFKKAFKKFLDICGKYGIHVMPIFFDDCAFGVNTDPQVGKQSEPLKGWYAWAWSPSPGYSMVVDEARHAELEVYVKDILTTFANDSRIMAWDLYNEPTNTNMPERSMPLLRKVFMWARDVKPSQPITSGIWNENKELNEFLKDNSDFITFHCYANLERTQDFMKKVLPEGRPIICTEWMNRPVGSKIKDIMPMLKERNIGSMMWGLVNGKTQTHLPWGRRPEHGEYKGEWQHDIFHNDLTPYDEKEISIIKELTK